MRFPPFLAALLVAGVAPAIASAQQSLSVGSPGPTLTFTAPDTTVRTVDPAKASATVVIFVSDQCPVSNAYNERMTALHQTYENKPVQFAFVDANATESPDDIVRLEQRAKFPFRIHRDVNNVIADKLGAQFTPEVFIFDKQGTLRYHGSIDDSRDSTRIQQRPARDAIDALLAGTPIAVTTTKAFGCSIKRAR